MAVGWQQLPPRSPALPFNGDEVLLAVPNLIGVAFGGDGRKVDPGHPFTLHLARWDDRQLQWVTNETDDDTGGVFMLDPMVPVLWAEINMPA
jgi:hypothetical protein